MSSQVMKTSFWSRPSAGSKLALFNPAFLYSFLPSRLPARLPAHLPAHLPARLPACLPAYLLFYLPPYLPATMSAGLSTCPPKCLHAYMSSYLFSCLFVSPCKNLLCGGGKGGDDFYSCKPQNIYSIIFVTPLLLKTLIPNLT